MAAAIAHRHARRTPLELLGTAHDRRELLPELLKDRAYYTKSGGGVTLSGGEPTLQASVCRRAPAGFAGRRDPHRPGYLRAVLARAPWRRSMAAGGPVSFSISSCIDPARHRRHTGQDNAIMLENLRWLADQVRSAAGGRSCGCAPR